VPAPRLAIDLSSDTLRVLEGSFGEPVRSGEAAVPVGAMDGGRVVDVAAVGQALRTVVARSNISANRALIVVSDALASFRVFTFPNSATEAEINAHVSAELNLGSDRLASRHVEVPISQQEKTVFAAVWDRVQVDTIARATRAAGLEPIVADLKSLCLARAVGVETCILIDTTAEPAEVVLIDRRVPRVRHTFKVGSDGHSAQPMVEAVRAVVSFHLRSAGTGLTSASPILVRSVPPLSSLEASQLAGATGRPVEPVGHPARVDSDLRLGPFLACLGLMMRRNV